MTGKRKIICLDTETTGLGDLDEILTLSIVDADGDVLYDGMFDPVSVEEWPQAQAVNGISPEDVAGCPAIREELPKIQEILDDADEILGYNVNFDLRFLERAGAKVDHAKTMRDPQADFAAVYGERDGFHEDPKWQKLTKAAECIDYDWGDERAHGSLADARATLALAKWLYGEDADDWTDDKEGNWIDIAGRTALRKKLAETKRDIVERDTLTLAELVDLFSYDFDPYEYADAVEDGRDNVAAITADLRKGGDATKAYLADVTDPYNDNHPEDVERAESLLEQLKGLEERIGNMKEEAHVEDPMTAVPVEAYVDMEEQATYKQALEGSLPDYGKNAPRTRWVTLPKTWFTEVSNIYGEAARHDVLTVPPGWRMDDGTDIAFAKVDLPGLAMESKYNASKKTFSLPERNRAGGAYELTARKRVYVDDESAASYEPSRIHTATGGKRAGEKYVVEAFTIKAVDLVKACQNEREDWKAKQQEKEQGKEKASSKPKTQEAGVPWKTSPARA